jgi:hypothetical protein
MNQRLYERAKAITLLEENIVMSLQLQIRQQRWCEFDTMDMTQILGVMLEAWATKEITEK